MERENPVELCHLDFEKVFDSVKHRLLAFMFGFLNVSPPITR